MKSLLKMSEKDNGYPNDESTCISHYLKSIEKKRSCLMCNKMFLSKGTHNRRCPKCTHIVKSRGMDRFGMFPICKVLLPRSRDINNFTELDDYFN